MDLTKSIILLLVGAALFLIGMNMMSGGLKKVAGRSMKRLFNKIKNNRFISLGIGAGVTAIIQSSGATAAMTVGFMNAGAITCFQGLCLIFGAYIGTTVTGILVSLSSFNFSQYLVLFALVGVIMTFIPNQKVKNIGEILAGFGVLFFGLETMKTAFPADGELTKAFQSLFSTVNNPFLLLLFGALFTMLTQSSSATSGIVIIMVGQGAIGMTEGMYLVLGATIGTVMTTIIASIGGATDSKRTALICLIIRILTACIATGIVWPIEACCGNALSKGLLTMFGNNIQIALAMFLVFYNIIFIGLLLPFIEQFVKLGQVLVKDKADIKKKKSVKYIDDMMLVNPSIALGQAKNEVTNMLDLSHENLRLGINVLLTQSFDDESEMNEREENIDNINEVLTNYLIKLSNSVDLREETKIGSYFHSINDIERIGDHAMNFINTTKSMVENDLKFSDDAKNELQEMFDIIDEMFSVTNNVFVSKNRNILKKLDALEDKVDAMKTKLQFAHFERVTKNKCTTSLSSYFTSVVGELERVGDHLVNVGYSIINPIGSTIEEQEEHKKVKKEKKPN